MSSVYTVVQGDTLFKIAALFYGDGTKFPIIAQANALPDPNRIFPGQVLQIPDLTPTEPDPPAPFGFRLLRPDDLLDLHCMAVGCRLVSAPTPTPPTTHTVVEGETLSGIANAVYGNANLYPLIAAANHLANPNLIFPGQVLVIPPRPAPPGGTPLVVVVVQGDSLWDLAQHYYHNPQKYHQIAAANNIPSPYVIHPGDRLVMPGLFKPPPPPPEGTHIEAVTGDAHLIVRFGIQNVLEEWTFQADPPAAPATPPMVARARAAFDSRVVFALPQGTRVRYTVPDVLAGLTTLGLRVPPLAVARVDTGQQRAPGATGTPQPPGPDETAIEAPYRLIVSPHAGAAFTHPSQPAVAPDDASRVELWHTRLAVRRTDAHGNFAGVDESDDHGRTVRAVWTRDKDQNGPPAPDFGSLKPQERKAIVRQSADPQVHNKSGALVEPEPLQVDRFYLSTLGAWIDWRAAWDLTQIPPDPNDPTHTPLSAYRHLAPLGRDSYVRVEVPVYLFPFGLQGTLITITERKITVGKSDPAADLFQRNYIALHQHSVHYDDTAVKGPKKLPFTDVTIDPMVSPNFDKVPDIGPFVPTIANQAYLWKVTGTDYAGRQITMTMPLLAVRQSLTETEVLQGWKDAAVGPVPVNGADIAFARPNTPGDTTARTQFLEFSGTHDEANLTSTPMMIKADITIPALAAINRGGGPLPVRYHDRYTPFPADPDQLHDPAQMFLTLTDPDVKLDFAGGSDRGGGFIEPSVAVRAISRTQGAVGDPGDDPNTGIGAGQFDPAQFLGSALPKLFGLFDLKDLLLKITDATGLDKAPKLIADQLGFVASAGAEFANLTAALQTTLATLNADLTASTTPGAQRSLQTLIAKTQTAIATIAAHPIGPLVDIFKQGPPTGGANPAQNLATTLTTALKQDVDSLRALPDLPAYQRAQIERPLTALQGILATAQDVAQWAKAITVPVDGTTIRYQWTPKIQAWPVGAANPVFKPPPSDADALTISVEVRTSAHADPQSDVSAQLRNFNLQLLPDAPLMAMTFARVGFRIATGAKPEVDVQFNGIEFQGELGFIEKLRQLIPFDGFSDPPFVDVNAEGATAGFNLALPSVAVGVFSLQNISFGADCRVPFLGDAVTVGFLFCTKEAPFRLTVMAIGGGGWVGIRLSPMGLVMLEMGLEAGASLSVDLGVASGSVSVMVGVYLRLEDKKGQLTGYFRIRGEVEVLGIASASITLELSLTYDFPTGKMIGRATLQVQVEVLFFSASVEINCERKLAGSKGDPSLAQIMPPAEDGQQLWNQYFSSFVIGA